MNVNSYHRRVKASRAISEDDKIACFCVHTLNIALMYFRVN